jgi:hypothetical protein
VSSVWGSFGNLRKQSVEVTVRMGELEAGGGIGDESGGRSTTLWAYGSVEEGKEGQGGFNYGSSALTWTRQDVVGIAVIEGWLRNSNKGRLRKQEGPGELR